MGQFTRIRKKVLNSIPILKDYELLKKMSRFDDDTFFSKTDQIKYLDTYGLTKINYACGKNYLTDWLNVDAYQQGNTKGTRYHSVNLVAKHPFPNNLWKFGYAEDFLEHLHQSDSIIFLAECYRTLQLGGVLRLSFPGLEGVLNKHYQKIDYREVLRAKREAYTTFEHLHFYSRDELSLVAKHIGYREVIFLEHGVSSFPELQGLDSRESQAILNTFVELIK